MPILIIGVVLAVAVLSFMRSFTFFGETCFYVGSFGTTPCLPPIVFYGLLALAAVLVVVGLVRMIRAPAS